MFEMRELKTEVGVIFCNLCNQINGKCVNMIVSAANFAMSNSNNKCPKITSYVNTIATSKSPLWTLATRYRCVYC